MSACLFLYFLLRRLIPTSSLISSLFTFYSVYKYFLNSHTAKEFNVTLPNLYMQLIAWADDIVLDYFCYCIQWQLL